MTSLEVEAKKLIQRIADEVRPDATRKRISRMIKLLLGSFAPEHITTELLQNADDVEATFAEIKLTDKGILFLHNGYEFDEVHLRALCDIGETTKKPRVHIGFMGVGFKAAFKVSDKPCVFSWPYRFYFTQEEVIVPYWLDKVPVDVEKHVKQGFTAFFLPFRRDLPSEIVESLKKTLLTKLEPLCLVFLRNIIKIQVRSGSSEYILEKTNVPCSVSFLEKKNVLITKKKNSEEKTYSYMVFNKTLEIPDFAKDDYRAKESRRSELKATDVTLAFTLKNDIVEPVKSVLYTFLPTPYETGLSFTVNCDFLLNTQRSEMDFTSKWNIWLLQSIGNVLKEIAEEFIHDENQKLCFYNVLPRRKEVSEMFFAKVAEPLLDHMMNNPCVVTAEGNLAKPSEVVLASAEIHEIIPPRMADVKYYVNADIRGRIFLRDELGIRDLCEASEERKYVLKALDDEEWLLSLGANQACLIYEFLYRKVYGEDKESWKLSWHERSELENQLKELRIVRCTNGLYHKPGEMLLPSKSKDKRDKLISLPCLIFAEPAILSEQSREFLKNLGARDFNEESIVSKILDGQSKGKWENWTMDERLRSISYIGSWLNASNYRLGREIKSKLGYLILPIMGGSWALASNCYIPNSELKELLPNANFVELPKIEELVEDIEHFLEALDVIGFPRVFPLGERGGWVNRPPHVSEKMWEAYWRWLHEEGCSTYEGRDHIVSTVCLDGFDECVSSQDIEKLAKYLTFLLEQWDEYYSLYKESPHRWFYYYENHRNVPSYFTYQLKTGKWLLATEGLCAPSEVFTPLRKIRRVGGRLIPYLNISEDHAKQHMEFLQFLGVQTEFNLQMLLSILENARNAEVNDDLKVQLTRVYQIMATLCEGEQIEEEVYILDREGNFQPSQELYWLDDPKIEALFGEKLPAAWVPNNISRPQVEALFNALGVTKVSSITEMKRIDDGYEVIEDIHQTDRLRRKGDYIYSVLLHYKATKAEEFPEFVQKLTVTKVDPLRTQLKVLDIVGEIEVPCFCSEDGSKVYISSKAQITDIARELARTFGAPLGSEFTLNFVLSQQSSENILEQLRRSSIRRVSIREPEKEADLEELERPVDIATEEVSPKTVTELIEDRFEKLGPIKTIEDPIEGTPIQQHPEVIVDVDEDELNRDIEKAKRLLTAPESQVREPNDVWREHKEIEKVVSEPRVIVRPFVGVSTKKNWVPQILDDERIFVEVGIEVTDIESKRASVKAFRHRICKIVEVMGGNPDTVNVCIASPETDADRREGQLFFNVLRNDHPLRWLVVVARELAYTKFPKPSFAHINLMTNLITKALERIQEIYPGMFDNGN